MCPVSITSRFVSIHSPIAVGEKPEIRRANRIAEQRVSIHSPIAVGEKP